MYNGIGLSSARGSATSGHVQKNRSYVKPEFFRSNLKETQGSFGSKQVARGPDVDSATNINPSALRKSIANDALLDHKRKREMEGQIYLLRDNLELDGVDEDIIQDKCEALRQVLLNRQTQSILEATSYEEHEQEKRQHQQPKPLICFAFQKGKCKFGSNCKYEHAGGIIKTRAHVVPMSEVEVTHNTEPSLVVGSTGKRERGSKSGTEYEEGECSDNEDGVNKDTNESSKGKVQSRDRSNSSSSSDSNSSNDNDSDNQNSNNKSKSNNKKRRRKYDSDEN